MSLMFLRNLCISDVWIFFSHLSVWIKDVYMRLYVRNNSDKKLKYKNHIPKLYKQMKSITDNVKDYEYNK